MLTIAGGILIAYLIITFWDVILVLSIYAAGALIFLAALYLAIATLLSIPSIAQSAWDDPLASSLLLSILATTVLGATAAWSLRRIFHIGVNRSYFLGIVISVPALAIVHSPLAFYTKDVEFFVTFILYATGGAISGLAAPKLHEMMRCHLAKNGSTDDA